MENTSLSYKTLRNSAYYFVGYLLPILTGIIVTPFVVHHLGVAEYGIFILANTITAFLGYIDLGLGTAFTKYTAEYHARKDFPALSRLIGSIQGLSYIYGSIGLVVFAILGKWFLPVFHIQASSAHNIFLVFILAGTLFFINSISLVPSGIASALQRFDLITKINVVNLVLVNALTLGAVLLGYQLKAIMAINVCMVFLMFIAYRILAKKLLPEVPLHFVWHKEEIKKAYSFGMVSFFSSFSTGALVFLDRLIIPLFINPAQLAYYSLPGNVALKTPGVTNSLSVALFPMASALQGSGEEEKMAGIYVRAFRNLSIVAAAATTGIVLFARPILFFWLGADFSDHSTNILIILAVTNYMISLYVPLQSMLQGLGRLQFLFKQSMFMAALNLVLLLILVPKFGIMGAAWAYLFSILPMGYAFYWVEYKQFGLSSRLGYYIKLYFGLLVTAAITGAIVKFGVLPWVKTIYILVVTGPLTVILYLMLYYVFGFADADDIETFKKFVNKVILSKFGFSIRK